MPTGQDTTPTRHGRIGTRRRTRPAVDNERQEHEQLHDDVDHDAECQDTSCTPARSQNWRMIERRPLGTGPLSTSTTRSTELTTPRLLPAERIGPGALLGTRVDVEPPAAIRRRTLGVGGAATQAGVDEHDADRPGTSSR